jgi:hypothetical protein
MPVPDLFPSDIAGILVLPQADESGVPKVIVARPFQELELSDQYGLEPPAVRHPSGLRVESLFQLAQHCEQSGLKRSEHPVAFKVERSRVGDFVRRQ